MIIRMRGVKRVRAKGHTYYYHRASMTRLPSEPGSAEFMAAFFALERKVELAVGPGTLGALIEKYRRSPEFSDLATNTQRNYQRVFDCFKPLAGLPLHKIDSAFLYEVRDRAKAKHKRSFANLLIDVVRLLFSWSIKRGQMDRNPALAVDKVKRPKDAKVVNRPWRAEELETVLAHATPQIGLSIVIAAYTGLRESNVVKVTWNCYDGTAFETRQIKTGGPVWVKAHYRLREILDSTLRVSPVILIGARGQPFTEGGLRSSFCRLIRGLVAEGKVQPGLSFHGLRHTLGTALAEAGCDAATIAAVLGQATTAMAEHYSKTAKRKHLVGAAIDRIEEQDRNETWKTGGKPTSN
jgi:integrase